MKASLQYRPDAALPLLPAGSLKALEPAILKAREEMAQDLELLKPGSQIPPAKQPLDAGFQELPRLLLEEHQQKGKESLLGRILSAAEELRGQIDRLVVLGIGGSYMGLRALFEGLCHPYHNELSRDSRTGHPRLYYEGNNVDSDCASGLLELLSQTCQNPKELAERWGIVVISKSGGTLETAAAFRVFREALEKYYGPDSSESKKLVIPVTGDAGRLNDLSKKWGYPHQFPIPDGVGGRFSVFTAVGLLPAAILGIDIVSLLQGAADMTERFKKEPYGNNPVLDYTAVCHLFEKDKGLHIRLLSTWGKRLEAAGLWYDQLLAESIGKEEKGATPLTVVNTRDLHSRGQQHQEGTRDKLITNVIVGAPNGKPLPMPRVADDKDQDQLNRLSHKNYADLMAAAVQGTNQAYAEVNRPTTDILLPQINAYTLGELLQMLMLATVLEGRLIGINPYGQPGVEAYKKNMGAILSK
ncbi:MAG: glucose-6-phosphate isomerase [Planctomycetales bacterium]